MNCSNINMTYRDNSVTIHIHFFASANKATLTKSPKRIFVRL
jgi:hypothetical protein